MNESTNPLVLPDQTMPQPGSSAPKPASTAAAPAAPSTNLAESTGTIAAPANYDPSDVAATRAFSSSDSKPFIPAKPSSLAGRYAVLRALAKGGMGQVSVARDIELDREIALKEIQPRFGMDSATLHRFLLEARVTGRLEHPGIVPVYGLGTYEDGRPYYAMRFITGHSFQEAIDEFHKKEGPDRDPQERSLALRQMLRRFVDVCNTIGYAHSRGILHRDIKPANVMIGGYGETLVVDWGLAKDMTDVKPSPVPPPADAQETLVYAPADPSAYEETKEGFTLYGQTMGTPAFMSPEQAAGKWDVTGVASDVYSLGAMLYAILSGSPPYSGPSMEVITRVQRGDHKPVKMVKGDTPSPLDAICRKAMAFDFKDRYPNALALASDVERWVADEPVSCYREPFLVRAGRWARRHRTAVAAASMLLLTGTIALTIGLYLVNHERREKEKAFQLASASRSETREALLDLTDNALGEILASSSKLTPEQAKFLNSISDKYRQFAEKEPDGPETKLFIAEAWYRIGRIDARLERYDIANESYAKALAMLDDPSISWSSEAIKARGDVQLYSGIVALQTHKPEAESLFVEAVKIFRDLIAHDPKPEYRYRLAQCQDRLGVFCLYAIPPRIGDAERCFQESLAIREQLKKEFPNNEDYQYRVAQSYRMLMDFDFKTGKVAAGREASEKALATLHQLVDQHQTSVVYLRLLADLETVLAEHYSLMTDPDRQYDTKSPPMEAPALIHSRGAVNAWGKLVSLNPGDTLNRQRLAEANCTLAFQSRRNNRPREAIAALSTAVTILREIDRDKPGNPTTELKLAQALIDLTAVYGQVIDKNAASTADEAVSAAEAIAKKLPENAEARKYAAFALVNRAALRLAKVRVKDSMPDPAGAKADLEAAWPHVEAAGNAEAALKYGQAFADWMDRADDYKEAGVTGAYLASLKLPGGMASFAAACFHGRLVKLISDTPDVSSAKVAIANQQRAFAIHYLEQAVKAGFDNADLLEAEPNLSHITVTEQFKDIVRRIRSKAPPGTKPRDN